jgi:hypothetical protein
VHPALLLVSWAAVALSAPAETGLGASHPNSLSASRVDVRGTRVALAIEVQVLSLAEVLPGFDEDLDGRVPAPRITEDAARIGEYVAAHYRLAAASDAATLAGAGTATTPTGAPWTFLVPTGAAGVREASLREGLFGELEQYVRIDLVYEAPTAPRALGLEVDLFVDTSPEHRDLCVVVWNSVELEAFDLAGRDRRVVLANAEVLARARAPFLRYLALVTGARGMGAPTEPRGVEGAEVGPRHDRRLEWELLMLAALVALAASSPRAGLGTVALLMATGLAGVVASRFVPVDARIVRFVTLAAPLSIAYLGLDVLLARTARTRLMETAVFGVIMGLALGVRFLPELAREDATEFQPASDVPAAIMGIGAGLVLLVSAAGLPGLAARPPWRARAARAVALAGLAIGGATFARLAFG